MAIYTFYPTQRDGLAASFEAFDLPDDTAAIAKAEWVLHEHLSAHVVVVWDGHRQVATRNREDSPITA